jgi:protein tyrosine/serine phosphatase
MYRSGTLSPLGLSWAHQIAGFKTIINLRSVAENKLPWHKQEQEFCQQNGIKMVDIPMNSDEPPTLQQVKLFLEVVKKPENLPIIVHCHQGVTRTAMMVAVYEIEVEGKDNEQVLKYMETFGHNFNKPEKEEIVDFILNYKRQKPESE